VRRQVTAYLSEEDFTKLRDEAEERGITLSRYIKERLFQSEGSGGLTFSDAMLAATEKRIIEAYRAGVAQSLRPLARAEPVEPSARDSRGAAQTGARFRR
jgi:hypothetical protein